MHCANQEYVHIASQGTCCTYIICITSTIYVNYGNMISLYKCTMSVLAYVQWENYVCCACIGVW